MYMFYFFYHNLHLFYRLSQESPSERGGHRPKFITANTFVTHSKNYTSPVNLIQPNLNRLEINWMTGRIWQSLTIYLNYWTTNNFTQPSLMTIPWLFTQWSISSLSKDCWTLVCISRQLVELLIITVIILYHYYLKLAINSLNILACLLHLQILKNWRFSTHCAGIGSSTPMTLSGGTSSSKWLSVRYSLVLQYFNLKRIKSRLSFCFQVRSRNPLRLKDVGD